MNINPEVAMVVDGEVLSVEPVVDTPATNTVTLNIGSMEQQSNDTESIMRMAQLLAMSKAGHRPGDTHTLGDVKYLVSKSGSWKRVETRKSKKAAHRKEVANRRKNKCPEISILLP